MLIGLFYNIYKILNCNLMVVICFRSSNIESPGELLNIGSAIHVVQLVCQYARFGSYGIVDWWEVLILIIGFRKLGTQQLAFLRIT